MLQKVKSVKIKIILIFLLLISQNAIGQTAAGDGQTTDKSPKTAYAIAVQSSGGISKYLETVIDFGKAFVRDHSSAGEIMIMKFVGRDKIKIVQPFTTNKTDLVEAFDEIFLEGGSTALTDAAYLAVENISTTKPNSKKVLLLITNGLDTNSYYNPKQLLALTKEEKVRIISVGLVNDLSKNDQKNARGFLERLAKESGGKAFFPKDVKDFTDIVMQVASEMLEPIN